MFFLRLTFLLILVLGLLVYVISTRIRAEFFKETGTTQPLLGGHSAAFEAFCASPPASVARLLALRKKLSVALLIAVAAFLLAIFAAAV